MQPWEVVDRQAAPDGVMLELVRHGKDWVVRAGGEVLMSSRQHGSEDDLARLALSSLQRCEHLLIGGLGMGFTVAATLPLLPVEARITVAELSPAIVGWNRGELGPLAGNPLQDPRVSVFEGDVRRALQPGSFDAIALDVDNGPHVVAHAGNDSLYGAGGSKRLLAALRPGGVLAVWSAGADPRYERALVQAGFREVRAVPVRARKGAGARHVIFLAERPR